MPRPFQYKTTLLQQIVSGRYGNQVFVHDIN